MHSSRIAGTLFLRFYGKLRSGQVLVADPISSIKQHRSHARAARSGPCGTPFLVNNQRFTWGINPYGIRHHPKHTSRDAVKMLNAWFHVVWPQTFGRIIAPSCHNYHDKYYTKITESMRSLETVIRIWVSKDYYSMYLYGCCEYIFIMVELRRYQRLGMWHWNGHRLALVAAAGYQ